MEPTNDHEQVIAEAVDKKFLEEPGEYDSIVRDIAMSLDFLMSHSDGRFLVDYVHWRLAHRISPANSK